MSKTVRKFRGKVYRQGHEPCELELTRLRVERKKRDRDAEAQQIRHSLRMAAILEQEEMGYGNIG